MKYLILLSLLLSSLSVHARVRAKCSLKNSMEPKCYHKRDKAILKIALVSYGSNIKEEALNNISLLLKERFAIATNNLVKLEIISQRVMDFKHSLPDDFTSGNITDPERLHRIWYHDNVSSRVMQEIYQEFKTKSSDELMDELDAILAVTGAQFNGLGFANGRISITESPREVAWALPNGGRVDYPTQYEIVDEFIHELGHNMFLGHSSTQCIKIQMRPEQRKYCNRSDLSEEDKKRCRDLDAYFIRAKRECCEKSPSKNDVMSYCRGRAIVDENKMYGFEACNLSMIEELIVPAMLSGGKWNVSGRKSCK
jgi:hypothetical protein